MKRKILRGILSIMLIALAFSLVACSEGETTLEEGDEEELESQSSEGEMLSENVVTIKIAVPKDDTGAMDLVIQTFNESHGYIVVEPIYISGNTQAVYLKMDARLSEQSTAYDLIAIDSIWCRDFTEKGYFRPLDEMIYNNSIYLTNYNPSLMSICEYDGFTFAFPYYADVGCLYYRKDIVSQEDQRLLSNGLYDDNDLYMMAEKYKLTEDGTNTVGIVFPSTKDEDLTCMVNEFTSNFEKVNEGLDMMKYFVDAEITPVDILEYDQGRVKSVFLNGQSVFARGWTDIYHESRMGQYPVTASIVGCAPLPNTNTMRGNIVGVSRYSQNKEAAEIFLMYLTGPIGQKTMTTVSGYMPSYTPTFDDADVQIANPLITDTGFLNAFSSTSLRPITNEYDLFSSLVQDATYDYLIEEKDLAEVTLDIQESLSLVESISEQNNFEDDKESQSE